MVSVAKRVATNSMNTAAPKCPRCVWTGAISGNSCKFAKLEMGKISLNSNCIFQLNFKSQQSHKQNRQTYIWVLNLSHSMWASFCFNNWDKEVIISTADATDLIRSEHTHLICILAENGGCIQATGHSDCLNINTVDWHEKLFYCLNVTVAFRSQLLFEHLLSHCAVAEIYSLSLYLQVVSNARWHQCPLPAPADISANERVLITVPKVIQMFYDPHLHNSFSRCFCYC